VASGLLLLSPLAVRAEFGRFDVLIRGGSVYDGSGGPPHRADVNLRGDRIETVGNLADANNRTVLDATDLAVTPGFVNMLS
jgi:N-acyl-D-amino-acid deacylase